MKFFKKYILGILDICLFAAIFYLKALSLNYKLNLTNQYTNWQLKMGCIGSVLIIISIACLFKNKGRIRFLFILDFVISLIFVTDIVYNRYFSDVTSVALLKQAKLLGEVKSSVRSLLHISDIFYFADLFVFLAIFILLKKREYKWNMPLIGRMFLFSAVFLSGLFLSYISVSALNKEQPGILKTLYDKKYIVKEIGDINFHAFDLYRYVSATVFKTDNLSESEKIGIKEWYDQKNSSVSSKYNNMFAGKNLIIVQLESFQGFVLNRSINGQEITPNLNKIAKDSLVFDNYYCETAWGGTSDAEFLSNVSLLPAREGSVYYQYAGNKYYSIISGLKSKGYYSVVMHANRPGFWNRAEMYKSLGFDAFENENTYNIDDYVGLGLSDRSFFKQSISKIESFKQPFYAFMITLSSHYPFKNDNGMTLSSLNTGEFEGKLIGDYLKAVNYTDGAIGEFVDMLKKDGLWDNSVVVFYGDHSAIPFDNQDQLAELLYNKDELTPLEWFNAQKVVAMIHFPEGKIKGHNTITAGELDLYPTIANLFGFKADYALGRDLLNSQNGFMITRDRGWADDSAAYIQSIDKVVDIKTGVELDKKDYEKQFEDAKRYLEVSDATIEYNLIYHFENKFQRYAENIKPPGKYD